MKQITAICITCLFASACWLSVLSNPQAISTQLANSPLIAQQDTSAECCSEPFKGLFMATDLRIQLRLDLYNESVEVPGLEVFGPMNGYISGNDLYCTWYVSSIKKVDENKAIIHFSNELGSETQAVELTIKADSLVQFKQIDGSVLKKVVGKKLAKLPSEFTFKRIKK